MNGIIRRSAFANGGLTVCQPMILEIAQNA
jgi:hypothetical protein